MVMTIRILLYMVMACYHGYKDVVMVMYITMVEACYYGNDMLPW